jgi:hypothetical protein
MMGEADNWPNAWGRFSLSARFLYFRPPHLMRGKQRQKEKEDAVRRARILVVDDQAYVREFLSEELGQDGYVVKSFVALDRLKHEISALLNTKSACPGNEGHRAYH